MRSMIPHWMARQGKQCRRFLAVLPYLFQPRWRFFSALGELCRVLVFQGFDGLKAFCRTIEKRQAVGARYFADVDPGKRGYIIVAPAYVPNSAGIACLYRLCDELNRRGFPACIAGSGRTPRDFMAPLLRWVEAKELCRHGYTAVYPETVRGNPLRARSVARWVLNRPGLLGGDEVYDHAELVFCYSEVFAPYVRNRIAGKLYMPTIDDKLFYCEDGDLSKRSLECFYVGKSQWKEGFIDRGRVVEITREAPPKKELGKLFRASRVLYSFDNSTILIYEAILCGCPAVIIPDGTQTREDYQRLELGMDGIAWGLEELERVKVDLPKLRRRWEQVKRDFAVQLEQFIALTQSRSTQVVPSPVCGVLVADDGARLDRASA